MSLIRPNIVFIMPNKNHSGVVKRIENFIDQGMNITIYGFDRGYGSQNSEIAGVKINDLGVLSNQNLSLKRVIQLFKTINSIFSKHKQEDVLYYTFAFDLALILYLNRKKYIYEIRDLVYGYFNSKLLMNIFKVVDKLLISKSVFTVLLSQGFLNYLNNGFVQKNIIIQPNKIHHYFNSIPRTNYKKIDTESLKFGFVGNYRFPNTIMRFAEVIGKSFPQHKFYFFGDGIPEFKLMVSKLAKNYGNIIDFGKFRNPQDLESIYEKIDVLVACYDATSTNVRYAEPNKLYEAIFFNTPIVVSENTFLGSKVILTKTGYKLFCDNDQLIADFVSSLSNYDLNGFKQNMIKISNDEVIDDRSVQISNKIDEYFRNRLN